MARITPALLIALFLVGLAACQPAVSTEKPKTTAGEKERIEKVVSSYIKEHPQEILDSVAAHQRQAEQNKQKSEMQKALNRRVSVELGNAPYTGVPTAEIMIYEFSDFQCPYCARAGSTTEALMAKYKGRIAFAFKHFPLGFHKKARLAAKAAMAANEQNTFWPYKKLLMTNQQSWISGDEKKVFVGYAKNLGLDTAQFIKDMEKAEYDAIIDADITMGRKVGVSSTPSFIINGVLIAGAQPVTAFDAVIEAVLAKKQP